MIAIPLVGKLTTDAPLPASCYFNETHPLYETVRADLIAAGFSNLSTIGTGAYASEIWVIIHPAIHPNVKISPSPEREYDRYALDTSVVVTLSSS